MLNYWWVTRPKRKLDSIPEVLATFADISLNQEWNGQRNRQMEVEDALEQAGLKRKGARRDQSGSGARTYGAWLESLGLIFKQKESGNIKLTLAGEAILSGESPVSILTAQILKYQFPSSFSIGVRVNERFKIRPFRFLLRILLDERVGYLTQDEIGKVIIIEADKESQSCYEAVVNKVLKYREEGDTCLDLGENFWNQYGPGRGKEKGPINAEKPYLHLLDCANTIINWIEYTQLARRNDEKQLVILEDKRKEVENLLSDKPPFIDRPEDHEFFQRKYGLDPKHRKDTRNLEQSMTVTARMLAELKVRRAFISISLQKPVSGITPDLISEIVEETGIVPSLVEELLVKDYPHGNISSFMSSYFEMAFKGTEEAVEFEKATTTLFNEVFKYTAIHLGQTGSKSAPDILLISDEDGYQSIIDNKAYSKYSITGDHHNRMVHNYIEKIGNYSSCSYPIGYFTYIAGGFGAGIDKQIKSEAEESNVNGSGITVSNFITMIKKQASGEHTYSHSDLRHLFGLNRQIRIDDIVS